MQTNPVSLASVAGASALKSKQEVSSDMFLKLLVTQLKNQDPLSPTDNTAFVAQLAQFSSLEGIKNLNKSFTGVSDSMGSLSNYSTANLIGRDVKVKGDTFAFKGTPAALDYELKNPVDAATLTVFDSLGRVVGTSTAKDVPAGSQFFSWDGLDKDGNPLAKGEYNFTVTTDNASGKLIPLDTFVRGKVKGVHFMGGEAKIDIDGGLFPASDIKEIF